MKRKDKHINKFLHEPLPDPEVPADDAWAGMSDMLDTTTGQEANGQGQLSRLWKSLGKFKGLLIGVSLGVTSAVVLLIVLNAETKDQKLTNNQPVNSNTSSISSKIQDSAQAKIDIKTPALQLDSTHFGAAGTPSETASLKTADAPNPIASADPVISEDERIEAESKHSPTAATSSRRTRARGTHTVNTRTHGTHTSISRTGDTRTDGTRSEGARTGDPHSGDPRSGGTRSGTTQSGDQRSGGQRPSGQLLGNTQAGVTRTSDTHISANAGANGRGALSSPATRQTEAASPTNRLGAAQSTQETVSSFSLEKNNNAAMANMSLNSLEPLSGYFKSRNNDLGRLVKKPKVINAPQPPAKARSSIWQDIHFGPEWNINRSIVSTDYIFTNADSIKRPARLAIPGIFVSRSWNKHTATFIFNPLHSYFGDKERVAQRLDTLRMSDSTYFVNRYNTNFIKSFGMNFSLQYQYRVFSEFSLVGGVSYAKYSSAFLLREVEYSTGFVTTEKHLAAKSQDALKSYIRPHQWNIRAGILVHSPSVFNNRLQLAWMTTFPVSNLSLKGFKSVKTPNMQVSLRFLVK
ncbi:hypothetical protein [Dyadobacter sp. OTU695]|uniref:hypothetical protein n=1 Tax=Dyadobacter sp. OTU695 TaxID=3043860 RepID=UPI00313C208A